MAKKRAFLQQPASKQQATPKKRKLASTSLINPPKRRNRTPERKNIDTLVTTAFPFNTTTATITLLNGVDDGIVPTSRIGRKITMDSITWKCDVRMAATTTGASALRYLIVFDKQPNGATATATDILNFDSITGLMNLANSKRFVVISDKTYNGIGTAGPQSMFDSNYVKLNLETEFNDNSTATITSITTGAVLLLQWQDGGLQVATPFNSLVSRVRFTDN